MEVTDQDRRLGAASIYEANEQKGALDPHIRQIAPARKLFGRAFTVASAPGDNLTLHVAVAQAKPGDVIIADVGGYGNAGHWGEILTVAAQARGIEGLVINGGVRDVEQYEEHDFPCFATSVCMKAAVKKQPGVIGEPLVIGGVLVKPGDLVCGDGDGVVVISAETAAEVLQLAHDREAKEATLMGQLREGELTLDLLNLRQDVKSK